MIFNATNISGLRVPSAHTSSKRYLIFNKMAADLMELNESTKISVKIEDGEFIIYHDPKEGVVPDYKSKTKNYSINSVKLVNFIVNETKINLPKFQVKKLHDGAFELVLKQKSEL